MLIVHHRVSAWMHPIDIHQIITDLQAYRISWQVYGPIARPLGIKGTIFVPSRTEKLHDPLAATVHDIIIYKYREKCIMQYLQRWQHFCCSDTN